MQCYIHTDERLQELQARHDTAMKNLQEKRAEEEARAEERRQRHLRELAATIEAMGDQAGLTTATRMIEELEDGSTCRVIKIPGRPWQTEAELYEDGTIRREAQSGTTPAKLVTIRTWKTTDVWHDNAEVVEAAMTLITLGKFQGFASWGTQQYKTEMEAIWECLILAYHD